MVVEIKSAVNHNQIVQVDGHSYGADVSMPRIGDADTSGSMAYW